MSTDALRVIAEESDRFAAALTGVDPSTPAPTTPGWTAADLLWHLTEVQLFWAGILSTGATTDAQVEEVEQTKPTRPTSTIEIASLRERATHQLVAMLAERADEEPAWSWFTRDQSVGFTRRMQTHEATIHRVDAELTADLPVTPIPEQVARDGIDHVLDVMWAWAPALREEQVLGVVRLDEVDESGVPTGTSWPVEVFRWTGQTPWGQTFTDRLQGRRAVDAGTPAATVAGTADQLDRLVWNRPSTVQRSGNTDLLASFDQVVETGIV